ncbi:MULTISPECIES: MaoC family dehydratase N-terminal domain-containing protein [unclassified Pseudomonas]|uniref:FAS1-like dehydratase domain-containing protein n=1 Tax=unclassified Pseudomonas TaxID=196821 RepID=UPI001610C456|nr:MULTISPECIES: MaoC family dehydratase N-terminal domain-containing protein [unclassified Pseudomonas]MBB6290520.1 acyl-CoA thioesterase FadM [Pseudomonas sp. SJZ073]MBB6315753.1 acyl-CoA thioesterase FadM [Pseudomonas sp. JAI120]
MTMRADAWEADWQPMITAIGRDFDDLPVVFVADRIERSAVRRWLEPLEFDCALHFDTDVARMHGYKDLLVPNAALSTFALAPMWRPGEVLFTDDARDAQPSKTPLSGVMCDLEPITTALFVTDLEIDYLLPVTVGDRLLKRGARLIACIPKETKVGRGAFITWQSELFNDHLEVVARSRTTYFRYNPHPRS